MSESKHTQGPWVVEQIGTGIWVGQPSDKDKNKVDRPVTSFAVRFNDSKSEKIANANLIAAAPDMLEALEHCAIYITQKECAASITEGNDAFDRDATPLEIKIYHAICKAKGEIA